jgi:ABC-type lipoprotein export system ATPase subunit
MSQNTGKLEVKSLYHRYLVGEEETVTALAGVDLEVSQGEFLVVIGPNRSGKSTWLSILTSPPAGVRGMLRVWL